MIKREMPGVRLLVSHADLNQGHEGKIYQSEQLDFCRGDRTRVLVDVGFH
jgi:hypothetical protein